MDDHLYDAFLRLERSHWWFVARRRILLDLTHRFVARGGRILDVGCGTGYHLEAINRDFDAHGIDISPAAVQICRKRGLRNVTDGTITDLACTGVPPFQAVMFLDVLEHVDDDIAALQAARAILDRNGVVIVTVPAYQFLWSTHDEDFRHRRRYVASDVGARLEAAGFHVELLTYFNTLLFPVALGRRIVQRVVRRARYNEFALPPAWLNGLFCRMFSSEAHLMRLVRPRLRLPFGLSVAAVGRATG